MCKDTQIYIYTHAHPDRKTKPINSIGCKEIAESVSESGFWVYVKGCDGMAGATAE